VSACDADRGSVDLGKPLRNVWVFRSLGRTRTLDSHASRLRRKLNRPGEVAYVVNVWGVGYRLVGAAG
jgi:DNA-binding response OmpR family regulator